MEEKRKSQEKNSLNMNVAEVVEKLKVQLNAQQESVAKNEAKVKKRESEVRKITFTNMKSSMAVSL